MQGRKSTLAANETLSPRLDTHFGRGKIPTQANGPPGVGAAAVASPGEIRAGGDGHIGGTGGPRVRAVDGDDVIAALGAELGGAERAGGVDADRAGLAVAVAPTAVSDAAGRVDLAVARTGRHRQTINVTPRKLS